MSHIPLSAAQEFLQKAHLSNQLAIAQFVCSAHLLELALASSADLISVPDNLDPALALLWRLPARGAVEDPLAAVLKNW
ncbi:MAG: hypothetical protein ACYCZI_03725 [Metallibacterium scheffleri]|jgi:hypothetical protein